MFVYFSIKFEDVTIQNETPEGLSETCLLKFKPGISYIELVSCGAAWKHKTTMYTNICTRHMLKGCRGTVDCCLLESSCLNMEKYLMLIMWNKKRNAGLLDVKSTYSRQKQMDNTFSVRKIKWCWFCHEHIILNGLNELFACAVWSELYRHLHLLL